MWTFVTRFAAASAAAAKPWLHGKFNIFVHLQAVQARLMAIRRNSGRLYCRLGRTRHSKFSFDDESNQFAGRLRQRFGGRADDVERPSTVTTVSPVCFSSVSHSIGGSARLS